MVYFIVTYPNTTNSYFDFDYYRDTHLPLAMQLLGEFGLCKTEANRCLPDSSGNPPAFACVTRLFFNDADRMRAGFAEHGATLKADIPNYTNIEAVFTLAEPLKAS